MARCSIRCIQLCHSSSYHTPIHFFRYTSCLTYALYLTYVYQICSSSFPTLCVVLYFIVSLILSVYACCPSLYLFVYFLSFVSVLQISSSLSLAHIVSVATQLYLIFKKFDTGLFYLKTKDETCYPDNIYYCTCHLS